MGPVEAPSRDAPAWAGDVAAVDWDPELDRIEQGLADVERALVRLDEGTYGTCEVCDAPIAGQVLSDAPTASRCPVHP